ncbi:plasmid replication initiation protein [Microbacterium sp. W4I20]|nr:plasmid replication initiation protein [Microbacterium sp. W4I20]
MIRRVLSVTVAAAILLSAGMVARADALEHQRTDAVVELTALAAQARSAAQRTDYLEGSVERAERDTADRAAVLEVRPAFVTEIKALRTAIERAEGKVDTDTHRASALSAQQTVVAEKVDPDTVTAATATVHALTAKLTGEVSDWQAAQSAGPGGPVWTTSGPDGYARVRAALDRVGGGGVGLYESSSCAGGNAPACANSNGYIKYRADIANWSEGRLNWAMAHELAHIHQFRVWGALNSSSAYGSLFGGDPEFLANCMAVVRGYAGSVGCNGDQQAWASGIWVGAVR